MASMRSSSNNNNSTKSTLIFSLLFITTTFSSLPCPSSAAKARMLFLVQQNPTVLKYHGGPLLKGKVTVNVLWYGEFTPAQRSIIVDFLESLSSSSPQGGQKAPPTVASWWQSTSYYKGGPSFISLGKQAYDDGYSLGKFLSSQQVKALALKLHGGDAAKTINAINLVLTSADVAVEDFCMSSCGSHDKATTTGQKKKNGGESFVYAWVGNPGKQCPGECAWPFHKPVVGPQAPPLVAPNGDVGVDGMVITLATVLAGTVTNPYDDGYFQGPATAALEAVTACTGMFGSGSFPGYPGKVLVDKRTKASYNAVGHHGREYLLPAMWDPKTRTCKTLV